jgi:hypothetical protein
MDYTAASLVSGGYGPHLADTTAGPAKMSASNITNTSEFWE